MSSNDLNELIHLVIDGEATPEEQARLQELLKTSPEARATYDALRELAAGLDSMPMADPPGIRSAVLSMIHPKSATPFRPRRKIALALAYAAAAIIVVGVLVRHAVPPAADTSGTMVRPERQWRAVTQAASVGATMIVRQNGDQYVVDLSLADATPVSVQWDGEKLLPAPPQASFQNRKFRLQLQRKPGALGEAAIVLRRPGRLDMRATVVLR